jgi:hypothetical protein
LGRGLALEAGVMEMAARELVRLDVSIEFEVLFVIFYCVWDVGE